MCRKLFQALLFCFFNRVLTCSFLKEQIGISKDELEIHLRRNASVHQDVSQITPKIEEITMESVTQIDLVIIKLTSLLNRFVI